MRSFTKRLLTIMTSLILIMPLTDGVANASIKSVRCPIRVHKMIKIDHNNYHSQIKQLNKKLTRLLNKRSDKKEYAWMHKEHYHDIHLNKQIKSTKKQIKRIKKNAVKRWHYRRFQYLKHHQYYRLGRAMATTYSPDITLEVIRYGKPTNSQFIKGFISVKKTNTERAKGERYNTKAIITSIIAYLHGNKLFKLGWLCSNDDTISGTFDNKYGDNEYKSPILKYYAKYSHNKQFISGWKTNSKIMNYSKKFKQFVNRNINDTWREVSIEANAYYKYDHRSEMFKSDRGKMFKRGWYDYNHYSGNSNNEMNPHYKHNKEYRFGFFNRMRSLYIP